MFRFAPVFHLQCFAIALGLTTTLLAVNADADATTIYGCKANLGGSVRIVNQPGSCTLLETPVQWKVTSSQGPQGIQGPQGVPGQPGPQRSAGATGT